MKSIKQKLMMLGLAASSLFAVPVVNASPLDDENVEETEDKAEDSLGDSIDSSPINAEKPAEKKESKSFLSNNKNTVYFIGGAAILYGILKVVEKKKNDRDN